MATIPEAEILRLLIPSRAPPISKDRRFQVNPSMLDESSWADVFLHLRGGNACGEPIIASPLKSRERELLKVESRGPEIACPPDRVRGPRNHKPSVAGGGNPKLQQKACAAQVKLVVIDRGIVVFSPTLSDQGPGLGRIRIREARHKENTVHNTESEPNQGRSRSGDGDPRISMLSIAEA